MAFEFIMGIINRWLLAAGILQYANIYPEISCTTLLLSLQFYFAARIANRIVVRSIHFASHRSIKKRI